MDKFFELIRIGIGTQNRFTQALTDAEWNELYAMANRHGISGILYPALSTLPREQLPGPDIMADWVTLVNKLKEGNKRLVQQADFVTRTFKKNGFRTIIIKGQSLSPYYPHPELRHSSDIDVWLEGTKEEIVNYISSVKKPETILYHHCDFNVIKNTSIEVHFTPSFFANPYTNYRFQKWSKKCGERLFPKCDMIESGFNSPDIEFNVPYLLTHFFRHIIDEELLIKPVIDYFHILRYGNLSQNQKEECMKQLKSFSLGKFVAGLMYVLETVCGLDKQYMLCPPNERYGKMILSELTRPNHDKGCLKKGKSDGNHIRRFIKREINMMRFLPYFPSEILWSPYWSFKIFYLLRKKK